MATNQISTSPYLLSDSNQASYRYNGELPPEESLAQQALNRRQHIANLLIQQGVAGAGTNKGQMVGRFYVPGSPVQGLADLSKIAAGVYGTYKTDQDRAGLADENRAMLQEALAQYKSQSSDVPAVAPSDVTAQGQQGPSTPGSPAITRTADDKRQAIMEMLANPHPQARQMGTMLMAEQDKADTRRQAVEMALLQASLKGQEPYTLTPGQQRFGPEGPLAAVQPNAVPINSGNQTSMVNPQTGQPVGAPIPMGVTPNAAMEDTTKRELFPQVSGNAAAAAAAQGGIALQAHQDRVAQLEQNNRQDNAMLEMRKSQGLSDAEYKKERLALDAKHQAQQAQMDKERLAIQRETMQQGKTPPGYEKVSGGLKAIPGGPADLKQQGKRDQAQAALQSMNSDLDRLAVSANQILNHPGLPGIFGVRGAIPDIPGTPAADARALINKLKSQVGFTVLQNMRNNSKTGGALGQVSDNEGKRLENNLASLESAQGIEQGKRELQGIIEYVNGSKDRLQAAYDETYGDTPTPTKSETSTVPTTGGKPNAFQPFHDPSEEEAYQKWKQEHK